MPTKKKSVSAEHPFVGKKAPAFSLPTDQSKSVKLSDYAGKYLVIYFYPKDMTPGCTQESCEFGESYSTLKKLGAQVLGVSRDSVESHKKFSAKHSLPFELISDADGAMCEKYGVWQEKSLYGRKFMGIVRSTFIVGPDSRVLKVYQPVKVTGHVKQVMEDLKGFLG